MYLIKGAKLLKILWPFIKEMCMKDDGDIAGKRKATFATITIVIVFLFYGDVKDYVIDRMSNRKNATSTYIESNERPIRDVSQEWVDYLKNQLTSQIVQSGQLKNQLDETTEELEEYIRINEALSGEVEELRRQLEEVQGIQEEEDDVFSIYDRLQSSEGR